MTPKQYINTCHQLHDELVTMCEVKGVEYTFDFIRANLPTDGSMLSKLASWMWLKILNAYERRNCSL